MGRRARRCPRRGAGALVAGVLALAATALVALPAGASGTTGTGTTGTTGRPAPGSSGTSGHPPSGSSGTTTTTSPAAPGGPGICAPTPTTTTTTTTTSTSTTVPGQPPPSSTTTIPPTTTTGAPTTTTLPAPLAPAAYDLVTSDGAVHPYGSPFVASTSVRHLHARVVGAVATPDGGGYWLVAANGSVYKFGDARFYGSPAYDHDNLHDVVGMAAVADGEGYWLTTSAGAVYAYGQAAYCGGANALRRPNGPVVAIAATADGAGYWLATARGSVYNFGDARFHGSAVHVHSKVPVVAMAATPDGDGYWLAFANGSVRDYGDARFYGSAVHDRLVSPVVAIAPTEDGKGYWLAGATGWTASYGDAPSRGSFSTPPPKPVKVVAMVDTHEVVQPMASPFAHGALGYDVSGFQCASRGSQTARASLPAQSAVEVLEVVGWLDNAENSCLASEAAWATRMATPAGAPYNLYIFMNSPDTSAASLQMEATGPAGTCATLATSARAACDAYNYGYNGAAAAVAYAAAEGVRSSIWWLDVENDNLAPGTTSSFSTGRYWSASTTLNDQTLQGAIDAVRHAGAVAGIYSTTIQYSAIAGGYVPTGSKIPLWIAGVPWTSPPYTERGLPGASALAAWCAGTASYAGSKAGDVFAGGVPWLLQETPGNLPSPYGLDPDYAC